MRKGIDGLMALVTEGCTTRSEWRYVDFVSRDRVRAKVPQWH